MSTSNIETSSNETDLQISQRKRKLIAALESNDAKKLETGNILSLFIDKRELCEVCGDYSSGRHYGKMTCEGCKSFFKRCIKRKVDFVCRNNRACVITMQQRNQCQACRFYKCLEIGMRKEVSGLRNQNVLLKSEVEDPTLTHKNKPKSKPNSTIGENSSSSDDWDAKLLRNSSLSIKDVLNEILIAENAAPIVRVDDFLEQSLRILYSIIEWSKSLIVIQEVTFNDKLLLLQSCWHLLFIVNYSLCGLNSRLLCSGMSNKSSYVNIQSQLLALNRLPLDPVEYGCLKALIYFDPDIKLLFNCTAVDKSQELIQEALENHVNHSSSSHGNRFGKVLLKIPFLRSLNMHDVLDVFFNKDCQPFVNSINELFHNSLVLSKTKNNSISLFVDKINNNSSGYI